MNTPNSFTVDIDGLMVEINCTGSTFAHGNNEVLVNPDTDILFHQDWYKQGYKTYEFLPRNRMDKVIEFTTEVIRKIVDSQGIKTENFTLAKYHHYVTDFDTHLRVVKRTRDLFPEDFNFDIQSVYKEVEDSIGIELSDFSPHLKKQIHLIVRINRPKSTDFNPPHKDVYGSPIKNFLNAWIPLVGVNENSSLPLVPSSHLLNENQVYRTFKGGIISGNQYRVVSVSKWNDSNHMTRPEVKVGEVLIFTPHLIHGCAFNNQEDTTRVSLELRLFKKQ
jgi:hypothetical protein